MIASLALVRSNYQFAQLVLSRNASAEDCARALLPRYPFPAPGDQWWETATGKLVSAYGAEVEMTPMNMFQSPGAACVRLYPAKWRCGALRDARARVVIAPSTRELVDKLIELHMAENNCSRQYARLQLAAADVHPLDDADLGDIDMCAYLTYDSTGCHLYTQGADVPHPTAPCFTDMQDDLNITEQLAWLILTNGKSPEFRRVAFNQPLALGTCKDGTDSASILGFCAECCTNWDTDASCNPSDLYVCPEKGCSYMIHETCCGRATAKCPDHPLLDMRRVGIERTGHTCPGGILACTGLVPMHGAWCLVLGYWPTEPNTRHAVGLLHPISIASVVETSDDHISSGRWFALHATMAGRTAGQCLHNTHGQGRQARRVFDLLAEMHGLYHLEATSTVPLAWPGGQSVCQPLAHCIEAGEGLAAAGPSLYYPDRHGLGQLQVTSGPALRLSGSIATILRSLQVYSEPHFSRMCERLQCSNEMIIKWMMLALPLLPGETSATYTDANARLMHAQVHAAVLAGKTRQRALQLGRHMKHWSVLQADAVLPSCAAHDTACLRLLGVTETAAMGPPRAAPLATPDVTVQAPRQSNRNGSGVFALRLMMNPSLHQSLLRQVVSDASKEGTLTGATEEFFANEIPPIPRVLTVQAAIAFRAACIRSAVYGRLFMHIITSGTRYTNAAERDPTGVLAAYDTDQGADWCGDWSDVNDLCQCTSSVYAAFGCGTMQHWRTVLMNDRPAYLFDDDLLAITTIAGLGVPDTAHIVPCTWRSLTLDDISQPRVAVVLHKASPVVPLPGMHTIAHYMSIEALQLTRAHKYMALRGQSKWKHYACAKLDSDAAFTYSTYLAMHPKHQAHRE